MQKPFFYLCRGRVSEYLTIIVENWVFAAREELRVKLFTNDFSPNGSDISFFDLVEPTFPGYSEKQCSDSESSLVAHDQPTDRIGIMLAEGDTSFLFRATANPAAAETIYGWWLWDADDELVVGAARFDQPVVIERPGDFVEVSAVLGFFADFFLFSR